MAVAEASVTTHAPSAAATCWGLSTGASNSQSLYPNRVCPACNDRAVTSDGQLATDWDEDKDSIPVYIDGKQCWRRYRFQAAAMYDPYNCQTLEEFHDHIFPK